ncbi:DUF4861 family protein [Sphingobacterium sp. HJSM2_6]|uniref:DUF4861 family protein n=1 Tax=Sphingobacterium sp. HJSM2_6 TaxID=3366264 RepID=UPI003BD1144E
MKIIWLLGLCTFLLTGNVHAQKYIQVVNSSATDRNEVISISYAKFSKHFNQDSIFSVQDENAKVIPHQLEKLGGQEPVNVLLLVHLAPYAKLKLLVSDKTAPHPAPKTFARYVPERFDDFAWENDVLAFRMYGKALEGRADDAQGMDVWAKRTSQLIINEWYKTGDYHKDHGEGLDYYSVGQTLGAGDVGFYIKEKLTFSKHYRNYKILDNGPLRTTFKLDFDPEEVEGQRIVFSKTIRLDAGSNFNKITLNYANQSESSTPIAIGIAKRKEENPLLSVAKKPFSLTYWEPAVANNGVLGVAVIIPKAEVRYLSDRKEQSLLITHVRNHQEFIYYNGAAWNKAGKVSNEKEWIETVELYKSQLREPLSIKLK